MLNKKLDLRVDLLTFTLNNKNYLKEDLIRTYFRGNTKSINYVIQLISKNISNFDEVKLLMNKYYKKYFMELSEKELYNKELFAFKYLSKLSEVLLSSRDGNIILKYWRSNKSELLGEYNGINKIAIWNSMIRKIHPTFFVIQYLLKNGLQDERYIELCNKQVKIEDSQLENILNKGVAETHIHINAGINFDIRWNDLMNSDIKSNMLENEFILSNKEITSEEAINYIYVARFIRIVLSNYLCISVNEEKKKKLFNYCECMGISTEVIEKIAIGNFKEVRLDDLKELEISTYNRLNENDIYRKTAIDMLNEEDILRRIFSRYKGEQLLLENVFLFKAFKQVKEYEKRNEDPYFVKLLYKYVLIKNLIYKSIVSDNSVKGLDKFSNNFKESTTLDLFKNKQLELAIENQIEFDNLKKLEIRVGISNENSSGKLKRSILNNLKIFFETYKRIIKRYEIKELKDRLIDETPKYDKKCLPRIGIIYHFNKREDDLNKCWMYGVGCDKLYYEKIRNIYLNQIEIIKGLREDIPYLSNYIIGIDAASIEFNTDPWVFAPVFKFARDGEKDILFNREKGLDDRIKNLGLTFHVGEDFRHILSGFRNIYEVIEYMNFRAGDRIGHGIALGIDVNKWVEENNVVIIPKIEYLESLLWMWDMLTNSKTIIDYDINGIERKILDLAFDIFGRENIITVNMLYESYREKFKLYKESFSSSYEEDILCDLYNVGKNNILECDSRKYSNSQCWDYKKLFRAVSCSKFLEKMKEPIEVRVEGSDIYIIKSLQNMLLDLVVEKGIVVETNPTSNRVIGQINNIFDHYISNLNSGNKKKNVIVTINTDDPAVFNTNINNEFAYIFYSLLHRGYDRSSALKWIDDVRRNGIESSFIKDENKSIYRIVEEIDQIIEKINIMY